MSTDYLWSVQHKAFPLMVQSDDIERVRSLREAGLLHADIMSMSRILGEGIAFVTGITPAGRSELDRLRRCRCGNRADRGTAAPAGWKAWTGMH